MGMVRDEHAPYTGGHIGRSNGARKCRRKERAYSADLKDICLGNMILRGNCQRL